MNYSFKIKWCIRQILTNRKRIRSWLKKSNNCRRRSTSVTISSIWTTTTKIKQFLTWGKLSRIWSKNLNWPARRKVSLQSTVGRKWRNKLLKMKTNIWKFKMMVGKVDVFHILKRSTTISRIARHSFQRLHYRPFRKTALRNQVPNLSSGHPTKAQKGKRKGSHQFLGKQFQAIELRSLIKWKRSCKAQALLNWSK